MTAERERRYLTFIDESIRLIESYVVEGRKAFLAQPMRQDAIVWRLQAIADATRNHLSDELKQRHAGLSWRAVYGFRNVAAHQYADINLDLVWEIASVRLGELKGVVEDELRR